MFKDIDFVDALSYFLLVSIVVIMIILPVYAFMNDSKKRKKCWEMPYSEYKNDTRCQALLKDK